MERSSFVNDVYAKITDVFLTDIPVEKQADVKTAYLQFLHDSYDRYFDEAPESGWNNVARMCVQREKIVNLAKTADAKLAMLFPDAAYLTLEAVSLELAGLAAKKKNKQSYTIPKSKEDYREALDTQNAAVSERFRYSAERVYSEALVDLEFLFGEEEIFSFRQGDGPL